MEAVETKPKLEYVHWRDVRDQVTTANPKFAKIVDELDPDDSHKLIRARYKYGDFILKDGVICLPKQDQSTPSKLIASVAEALCYSQLPMFMIAEKSCELFIQAGSHSVPLDFCKKGHILGLFETADYLLGHHSSPKWCATAGSRSAFLLPKVTERQGIKRLREYFNLPSTTQLRDLKDHWETFVQIANHPHFEQVWECEILFFTEAWVSHKREPEWAEYRYYVVGQAWHRAQLVMAKSYVCLKWHEFWQTIEARHLKPRPYIAHHVNHLLETAAKAWPGFRCVDQTQDSLPYHGLAQAFVDVYGLKDYLPTIMQIVSQSMPPSGHIYLSLMYPTSLEASAQTVSSSTIMLDLREIKLLLDTLKTYSKVKSSFIENINLEYFHVEPDKMGEIQPSSTIPIDDPDILIQKKYYPNRAFCSTSSFWRGCVRINSPSE